MNRFHRWFCATDRWARAVEREVLPWVLEGIELGDELLEVGPGPGRATELLSRRATRLTSVEIDARPARSLEERWSGTNVTVMHGDATAMPLEDRTFTSALSLTMLHHVPSARLQDRLLADVYRVLRPGGTFAGCDSRWSVRLHLIHLFDTMVLIEPDGFGARLESAGFTNVEIEKAPQAFRFRAQRPRHRASEGHRS